MSSQRAFDAGRPTPYGYRSDPAVPLFPDDHPLIIYDGVCALCTFWMQFVLRHDRAGLFRLLSAQSPLGQALYRHYGLDPECLETVILLADGHAWFKSEAGIRTLVGVGFPWSLAAAFRIIPGYARDWLYDTIARNRFRLFGRRDACLIADPHHQDRFLP
jgi:predicted DCC family thiol-disulfide oxidoreductase YuxK